MPDQNSFLTEYELPTWAIEPKNWTGAASTGIWVSLKNYNALTIMILTGAWAAGTAAVVLKQATAIAGTGSKALALSIAKLWTSTSATGVLTQTAIVSDTFNLSVANTIYVLEIPTRSLDLNNAFTSVRVEIASPGANADFYGAMYLFRQARFQQGSSLGSVLPNPFVD